MIHACFIDDYLTVYREDALTQKLCIQEKTPYKVVDFETVFQHDQSKLMMLCSPEDMEQIKQHASKKVFPGVCSMQAGEVEFGFMSTQISKSVAMGNASDLTKSVANAVTLINKENGVADFLLRHLLHCKREQMMNY